jgi:hypothetical protein
MFCMVKRIYIICVKNDHWQMCKNKLVVELDIMLTWTYHIKNNFKKSIDIQ